MEEGFFIHIFLLQEAPVSESKTSSGSSAPSSKKGAAPDVIELDDEEEIDDVEDEVSAKQNYLRMCTQVPST